MKIGIIGCGLIGRKRAQSICQPNELIMVCDTNLESAAGLSRDFGNIEYTDDYQKLTEKKDIELVIVAVPNFLAARIVLSAVSNGKHVIVEKPGAIASSELLPIMEAIKDTDIKVKVGFNHRYHPAMLKAKELLTREEVGEIMFIRARYGHGGRVGYDKEWRADPRISGGGETIDQGVHLIDLSRWYMGEFSEINGFADTYFWNMPVDDNGFISLRKEDGRAAWLQVSCTEWKNMFSFEIYCKNAKLEISGLGGSYGVERLSYYQMLPQMGPPDTTIFEYPRGDNSWKMELDDMISAIQNKTPVTMGDVKDAYEALRIVEAIYRK